mmetsp:Transcript_22785/g.37755  ORF Transcript_22785/g.37755 Transcript_22785/m.37755 type:complete len:502 (+) Transcript_22785:35-1540(+)|eukprot:CAMPEP_0119310500 /NCGR_PEP_ID=MMETSP1333-20130426/19604_1 /TAXON_ID=418940 /ORGANISM="Scyphosphaera apsteinii, Strain RCC1455" /LENGTH=501 /DNA_ID=CAMNT_0007314695 /DNA_START=27 /DNA_END=1532 /DNA_ORIENTATION=-
MAQLTVYATEPATKGKVVLHTSLGPFDVELWSKEAPMACRNFVQLCLEGYYDGCIFHRVIKEFMAQTGDPTGTGQGGDSSIYGGAFKDEFHGRLRFTHRGLLGMASSGPDTNRTQFFITLDRCEWLDKKHTIFGKVTGNSLYNVARFNECEIGLNDRPTYPPRIERVEVLLEPFDDIVPRAKLAAVDAATEEPRRKKKQVKNLALLSFGEEAAEEERLLQQVETKVASSHDILDDPRLSREQAVDTDELATKLRNRSAQTAARQALRAKATGNGEEASSEEFVERMRRQMQQKKDRLSAQADPEPGMARPKDTPVHNGNAADTNGSLVDDAHAEYERLRRELAASRRASSKDEGTVGSRDWKWRGKGDVNETNGEKDSDEDSDDGSDVDDGATILEKRRAKFLERKRQHMQLSKKQRQEATLHKLSGFKESLDQAASEGADSWKTHVLKFERERREAESASQYDCVDPLKHGVDATRANAKIKERVKTMQSMKKGWADDDD